MNSNPPLDPLPRGEPDAVRPLRIPLLGGVQGWVCSQTYFKDLWQTFAEH